MDASQSSAERQRPGRDAPSSSRFPPGHHPGVPISQHEGQDENKNVNDFPEVQDIPTVKLCPPNLSGKSWSILSYR